MAVKRTGRIVVNDGGTKIVISIATFTPKGELTQSEVTNVIRGVTNTVAEALYRDNVPYTDIRPDNTVVKV